MSEKITEQFQFLNDKCTIYNLRIYLRKNIESEITKESRFKLISQCSN